MPKTMFDYCNFIDGHKEIEFVCHGAKYTKEEAIQLFILENDNLKMPTIEDVHQRWIRYYPKTPYFVDLDKEGGCYSYCPKNQRGSFPVWVINFESMKKHEQKSSADAKK